MAQVLPESVQHFMPQAASCLALHLEHEAQPLKTTATPTSATHRARVLMCFIWVLFGSFHATPDAGTTRPRLLAARAPNVAPASGLSISG